MEYQVFTDGGSRGNPGPSACAAVLYRRMEPTHAWERVGDGSKYLGDMLTNNHAEYYGLLLGVELAVAAGAKNCTLHVKADSELMVKQVSGIYKFKNLDLLKIAEIVFVAASVHGIHLHMEHVRREYNTEADRLCNLEMDRAKEAAKFRHNLSGWGQSEN